MQREKLYISQRTVSFIYVERQKNSLFTKTNYCFWDWESYSHRILRFSKTRSTQLK